MTRCPTLPLRQAVAVALRELRASYPALYLDRLDRQGTVDAAIRDWWHSVQDAAYAGEDLPAPILASVALESPDQVSWLLYRQAVARGCLFPPLPQTNSQ